MIKNQNSTKHRSFKSNIFADEVTNITHSFLPPSRTTQKSGLIDSGVAGHGSRTPGWISKVFSGLESFITNAHDPWLSEADRDPLACNDCCNCWDGILGSSRRGAKGKGNFITKHFNNEVVLTNVFYWSFHITLFKPQHDMYF